MVLARYTHPVRRPMRRCDASYGPALLAYELERDPNRGRAACRGELPAAHGALDALRDHRLVAVRARALHRSARTHGGGDGDLHRARLVGREAVVAAATNAGLVVVYGALDLIARERA